MFSGRDKHRDALYVTLLCFFLYVLHVHVSTVPNSSSAPPCQLIAEEKPLPFVMKDFSINLACPKIKQTPGSEFRVTRTATKPSYMMSVHPKGELISDALAEHGSWEYYGNEQLFASALQRPGKTVVNAGANIGALALYFAALGFETHAFEPEPTNFNLMECSGILNGYLSPKNLTVYNMAVGNNSKEALCVKNIKKNMGMSETRPLRGGVACPQSIPVVVLDEFVQANPNSFYENSFAALVVDVEGYEPFLFNGMQRTLANPALRPRYIDMELSCARWKRIGVPACQDVLGMVLRHGYKVIGPPAAVENLNKFIAENFFLNPNLLLMAPEGVKV